jgi:hypothetical protein
MWLILAAACLTWGLCAALVVALADRDGSLHHLLNLLHHHGGPRA